MVRCSSCQLDAQTLVDLVYRIFSVVLWTHHLCADLVGIMLLAKPEKAAWVRYEIIGLGPLQLLSRNCPLNQFGHFSPTLLHAFRVQQDYHEWVLFVFISDREARSCWLCYTCFCTNVAWHFKHLIRVFPSVFMRIFCVERMTYILMSGYYFSN